MAEPFAVDAAAAIKEIQEAIQADEGEARADVLTRLDSSCSFVPSPPAERLRGAGRFSSHHQKQMMGWSTECSPTTDVTGAAVFLTADVPRFAGAPP